MQTAEPRDETSRLANPLHWPGLAGGWILEAERSTASLREDVSTIQGAHFHYSSTLARIILCDPSRTTRATPGEQPLDSGGQARLRWGSEGTRQSQPGTPALCWIPATEQQ